MHKFYVLIIAMCMIIIPGCGKRSVFTDKGFKSDKQCEIASIDASVITVIPWQDIQDELQPVFPMNATEAFKQAIPVTISEERRILNSLQWYLKAALTQKLTTITSTSTQTSGQPSVTNETRTEAHQQPDLEKLKKPDYPTKSPNFENSTLTNNNLNPRLQYSAATALYQEVKLLNKYVKYASKRKGFVPYLVRMQVSLNPVVDDARYDAYSTISFFPQRVADDPKENEKSLSADSLAKTPFVVPLLVSEDLESSSYKRNNMDVLQMAMALQLTINSIGVENGFSKSLQDQLKMSGMEYNSLMTVGRISDNSIRVRFGAMQKSSTYGEKKIKVMVPRTHYVTLLLMAPGNATKEQILTAVTRTTLVNYVDGTRLEGKSHRQIFSDARKLLARYLIKTPRKVDPSDESILDFYGMASAVQTNSWSEFESEFENLCTHLENSTSKENDYKLCHEASKSLREQVWIDLVDLFVGGQYSYTSFELPKVVNSKSVDNSPVLPPASVSFTAIDNGNSTIINVAGAKNLRPDSISPVLELNLKKKRYDLATSEIEIADNGKSCTLTFPSLQRIPGAMKKSHKLRLKPESEAHSLLYIRTNKN